MTFFHPITLIGSAGEWLTLEALVDDNAMFAIFPASLLERLAVPASRSMRRLGREDPYRIGQIEAELAGYRGHVMCIFGDEDETPRLGSHTLTTMLLQVDSTGTGLVQREFQLIQHF